MPPPPQGQLSLRAAWEEGRRHVWPWGPSAALLQPSWAPWVLHVPPQTVLDTNPRAERWTLLSTSLQRCSLIWLRNTAEGELHTE